MSTAQAPGSPESDPRRLRELLARTGALACEHAIPSVVVGLAGREGDMLVPELLRFIESALRMEDTSKAERIVARLVRGFEERFPTAESVDVALGYYEVAAGAREVSAKEILPNIFTRKSR
jgi:hypothetical protein